jgi:hypothetical protein
MKRFPNDRDPLELRVNNRTYGQTAFGQMARRMELHHRHADDGTHAVRITVRVTLHALTENDELGEPLTGNGLAPYYKTLTADNNTIVDPETGGFLEIRQPEHTQTAWEQVIARVDAERQAAGLPEAFLQGDYFGWLGRHKPVLLDEMILQHMAAAQLMGHFQ